MAASSSSKTFAATDLQGQGKQLRHRGITNDEYKQPLSLIRKATKGNPLLVTTVHAITHHSWRVGADAPVPKKDILEEQKADKTIYEVGKPVAPQLAASMAVLQDAGVDVNLLKSLWEVFTGDPA